MPETLTCGTTRRTRGDASPCGCHSVFDVTDRPATMTCRGRSPVWDHATHYCDTHLAEYKAGGFLVWAKNHCDCDRFTATGVSNG